MSGHEDEVKQRDSQHIQSIKPTFLFTVRKSAARLYPIYTRIQPIYIYIYLSILAQVGTKRLTRPQSEEKTTRYETL